MLNDLTSINSTREPELLRERVDQRLAELVPESSVPPAKLHAAIRYSLLAPGKRIRPVLMLQSTLAFGGNEETALDPACALEMVHAASLIVDDFPFMDDASERRGMPANHIEFGLETATLAGFALLNRAFSLLAEAEELDSDTRVRLVRRLSSALGDCGGAIAGQEEDMEAPTSGGLNLEQLERMVAHKTAALFVAATESGALIAGASDGELEAARAFAWNFGLCFQAQDDLDDRPSSGAQCKESPDCDAQSKATYVSVLGVEEARRIAETYARNAVAALEAVDLGSSPLAEAALGLIGGRKPRLAVSNV